MKPRLKLKLKHNIIDIQHIDGLTYLSSVTDGSIDLILTDPPYIISHESGMNHLYQHITQNEVTLVKTEDDWQQYKTTNHITDDTCKDNFMRYGTIYGKKYCVRTNYGDWDHDFTIEQLDLFIGQFYQKLRKGGTLIIFFDLWKITTLKNIMERQHFKQIRLIEWIKTNPQPRNSKINYLTNCREIALLGVKEGSPTFNSSYDNGLYFYPLQSGKNRFHPTQKSLELFKELIKKHSVDGDTVMDTFLGGGTTAIACQQLGRNFRGCELSKDYYDQIMQVMNLV